MAPRQADAPEVGVSRAEALSSRKLTSVNGKQLPFTAADVTRHIGRYTNLSGKQNLEAFFYIAITVAAWIGCFFLPMWPTIFVHAAITIRLFVTAVHDTAHGSTFSKRWMNDLVGVICAPMTMTPYNYWQWGHDFHHDHSNDLDHGQWSQSAPLTVAEFRSWAPWKQAAYRIGTIPWVMLSTVAPIAMAVLQPMSADTARDWAIQLSLWAFMAYQGLLLRMVATMGLAAVLGVFMFHLQHTFDSCVREHGRDYFANGYYGSSLLLVPRWLRWATAGIEYHHIHHLNAKVPWYNLQRCHEEAPAGMWDGIKVMSFADGWEALSLVLYDEDAGRLVTMEQALAGAGGKEGGKEGKKGGAPKAAAEGKKAK